MTWSPVDLKTKLLEKISDRTVQDVSVETVSFQYRQATVTEFIDFLQQLPTPESGFRSLIFSEIHQLIEPIPESVYVKLIEKCENLERLTYEDTRHDFLASNKPAAMSFMQMIESILSECPDTLKALCLGPCNSYEGDNEMIEEIYTFIKGQIEMERPQLTRLNLARNRVSEEQLRDFMETISAQEYFERLEQLSLPVPFEPTDEIVQLVLDFFDEHKHIKSPGLASDCVWIYDDSITINWFCP